MTPAWKKVTYYNGVNNSLDIEDVVIFGASSRCCWRGYPSAITIRARLFRGECGGAPGSLYDQVALNQWEDAVVQLLNIRAYRWIAEIIEWVRLLRHRGSLQGGPLLDSASLRQPLWSFQSIGVPCQLSRVQRELLRNFEHVDTRRKNSIVLCHPIMRHQTSTNEERHHKASVRYWKNRPLLA